MGGYFGQLPLAILPLRYGEETAEHNNCTKFIPYSLALGLNWMPVLSCLGRDPGAISICCFFYQENRLAEICR